MVAKPRLVRQKKGVTVLYSGDFSKERTIDYALEQFEHLG
jgi:hypothetical protein